MAKIIMLGTVNSAVGLEVIDIVWLMYYNKSH